MTQNLYNQSFKNVFVADKNLQLLEKYEDLVSSIKNGEIPAILAIFDDKNVEKLENLAKKIKKHKKILVLGVGGSSLGGKTITALKNQEKLHFLESIDPDSVANCLAKFDLEKTFFLVISKSGETIETICQT